MPDHSTDLLYCELQRAVSNKQNSAAALTGIPGTQRGSLAGRHAPADAPLQALTEDLYTLRQGHVPGAET